MKRLLLLFFYALLASSVYAQTEICDDGLDNDGDGLIDCYDPDCVNFSKCNGSFTNKNVLCQAQPVEFPKFTITQDFASANGTTNHLARVAIGDLDRDGIPEMVTMNEYSQYIYVLDGRTAAIKYQLNTTFVPQYEVAIANIDNDNCAEIFTFGSVTTGSGKSKTTTYYLYAFDCTLTNQLWKTQIPNDPINFGVADFDGDGKVEVYAKDAIFDAKTGTQIVQSNDWSQNGGPVAVDTDGDGKLELVIGCIIYKVNLGARTLNAGSLTEVTRVSKANGYPVDYLIKNAYNATSVADYNQDGFLDIVASGGVKDASTNNIITTTFFWDYKNKTVKTYSDQIPGTITINNCSTNNTSNYYEYGWVNGTGRINIADLDGNGKLNASYVSGKYLYALDENFNLLWRKTVNEETSGYTGCTLFDFNGDGKSEIVYRDEKFIYILNGTDGSTFTSQPCISRTNREYPIVADVDADGATEICVPCGTVDADALTNFCDLTYSTNSQLRIFKSASEPWVPARRLWNQHGYFNVNVNDDLTIPKVQQSQLTVFSSGACTPGANRPLNSFLNQSPYLDSKGCPTYASPDLAYVQNSLSVAPPTCPNKDFTVSFSITNKGDTQLDGVVPVTFYSGDPTKTGAIKLNTINLTLAGFKTSAVFAVSGATVNGLGSPFTLYIVLNDNGSTVPTPISLPNTNFVECDYGNNIISAPVNPLPAAITAIKVADDVKCAGSATPDNGAVSAYVPVGATQNTADYTFYWSKGTVAKPAASADYVGSSYTGLAAGSYTVYAVNKNVGCSSDTATVVVNQVSRAISVAITLVNGVTNCATPNGQLQAVVSIGGVAQAASGFDFAWYAGNSTLTSPEVGVSATATDLQAQTYTVLVTDKLSGCTAVQSLSVPNNTVIPTVSTTQVDVNCSGAPTGSATATVGGSTTGYTFNWYNGTAVKPTTDFVGSSYNSYNNNGTGLPGGKYTVVAVNTTTGCTSAPVTVTINQTVAPTASASVISAQTSCDPTLPNGSASATGSGGSGNYKFEWFTGQNTAAANLIVSAATVTNRAAGTYTIKVTDNVTGCFGTAQVTIGSQPGTGVTINTTSAAQTQCVPYNGSITASVSAGNISDYTFSWYNGGNLSTPLGTPDYPTTGNVLNTLKSGTYTVAAVNNITHCLATNQQAIVIDASPTITIALNNTITVYPSLGCTSPDGTMAVDVTAAGNTLGFKVDWYKGASITPPPFFSETVPSTSTAAGIAAGVYTSFATDLNSGCTGFKSFNLPFAGAPQLNFTAQGDVTTCVPGNNGSISVSLIPSPALPSFTATDADYDLYVYAATDDPGAAGTPAIPVIPGVAAQSNYTTSASLTPQYYSVVAVANNPSDPVVGCRSVPVIVQILQNTTNPTVSASSNNPNTDCKNAAIGTGSLTASTGAVNSTFDWYNGSTASGGIQQTGSTYSNLGAGFYTVVATVTDAASQGCQATATYSIVNNPIVVSIAASGITENNLTNCDALGAPINGSATVTNITANGSNDALGNYTFAWSDASGAALSSTTATQGNLAAGTYYVTATNTTSGCSTEVDFAITDQTIGSVAVAMASFTSIVECVAPQAGELVVVASGNSATGYGYEWFNGASASGTVVNTTNDYAAIPTPGKYSIKVTNQSNNCFATDTYTLPIDVKPVLITASSSSPLTYCSSNNGTIFATVINDSRLTRSYTYTWSLGTVVGATAYTGSEIDNLGQGSYTVIATDNSDPSCVSAPKTVSLDDQRVTPIVAAAQSSPLSNCDPTKLNGVADASVNGDNINYTFNWYRGTTATGTPFFTGPEAGGLGDSTYTVTATDNITGCTGTTQVTVTKNLTVIATPQITVLSNVTSCVLENGSLSASVGGDTQDYIFKWYIGNVPTDSTDYTGDIITDLNVGLYTVTATDRATGCVSGPDTGEIIQNQVYPDFTFLLDGASCGKNDGSASLIPQNEASIESIAWDNNGVTVYGPVLANIPSGSYSVTVTSQLGCATSKTIQIKTDINPFNGVSQNNDGKNDKFVIDCIDNFPNNNVKIFNRAGTIVYESDGYNNLDTYFDGKSNRGISPMGVVLPDGTYFYIIDKKDGSKQLAGYLELVH